MALNVTPTIFVEPVISWPIAKGPFKGELRAYEEGSNLFLEFITTAKKTYHIKPQNIIGLPPYGINTLRADNDGGALALKHFHPSLFQKEDQLAIKFEYSIRGHLFFHKPGIEKTYVIAYPDFHETVGSLKQRVCDVAHIPLSHIEMEFVYAQETLNDKCDFYEYSIPKGSTVQLSLTEKADPESIYAELYGSEFQTLSMTAEIEYDPYTPKWKKIAPGLNLEGKCEDVKCPAYKQVVWIQQGIGEFDLAQQVKTSKCPGSDHRIKNIYNCGVYQCMYSIEGEKRTSSGRKKVEQTFSASDYFLNTFDPNCENGALARWTYLIIKTAPKKNEWCCIS